MPLGFERLNERTQRPNAHINFIRTLAGSTAPTAEAILSRVAAICYPFMKKHNIYVQALEEFPHNNEFVGRNFNAGEVIQLVLRNRQGQWLPERWVMMVMVHELAHCKQMNHSKFFWQVRDAYAKDLKELWAKGYTGEGLWGRGRALDTGDIHAGSVGAGDVPENLCGGTYGRRRRKTKRKVKETVSYAERKQRRILKKFGTGGNALGADDDTKVKLEGGVAKKSKPRVAASARGRDLRAAAALARFDPVKKEEVPIKEEEIESNSETEDEYEEVDQGDAALDVDGRRMVDDKGRPLVKICQDEDGNDENARREMEDIQDVQNTRATITVRKSSTVDRLKLPQSAPVPHVASAKTESKKAMQPADRSLNGSSSRPLSSKVIHLDELYKRKATPTNDRPSSRNILVGSSQSSPCSICSYDNPSGSLTCVVCSNVLNSQLVADHWKCDRPSCKESLYLNSGDAGVCGVCGSSRVTT